MMNQYYYSVDEKYLKAETKIELEEYHKAKILLEAILEEEPEYGKAHYQLGNIYRRELYEPDKAEFHFKMALLYAPYFPHTYYDYLRLMRDYRTFDDMLQFAEDALGRKYLCKCCIYEILAEASEEELRFEDALAYLQKSQQYSVSCDHSTIGESINRITRKIQVKKPSKYHYV